ncbi:hypothetical protein D3C84_808180 [compost metagenome]
MHDLLEARLLLLLPSGRQPGAMGFIHHLAAQLEQVIGDRAVDLARAVPVHQQVVQHLFVVTRQRVQLGSIPLTAGPEIAPPRRQRGQGLGPAPLGMLAQGGDIRPLDGRQPEIPLMLIEQGEQQGGSINRKAGT